MLRAAGIAVIAVGMVATGFLDGATMLMGGLGAMVSAEGAIGRT
jgi:hypothetical protein